jgi:hypothetical protein
MTLVSSDLVACVATILGRIVPIVPVRSRDWCGFQVRTTPPLVTPAFSGLVQPVHTTTYRFAGDCQIPANTCKPEQSWARIMG